MADDIDTRLRTIAERHTRALAEDMPLQAQLLILDADALLDAKLAADHPTPSSRATPHPATPPRGTTAPTPHG